MHRSIYT